MKGKALKMKKWLSYIIPCAIIPAFVAAGMFIFKDKQYAMDIALHCYTVLYSVFSAL